jgi:hypothetical protein
MREYALGEWRALRRGRIRAVAVLATAGERRRGRPRTSEEREVIIRNTVALVRRRTREGRLVRTGPGEYELVPTPTNRP